MKIALVTYSLQIGGIERVIFNQAKIFSSEGHDVTVVESQGKGIWNSYFIESGINTVSFELSHWASKTAHCHKLLNFLKDFDVLFIHDSPYVQAGISKLPKSVKVFSVLHSVLESMLDNCSANLSDMEKIITVSPYLKTLVQEERGVPDGKVLCIPTAVIHKEEIPSEKKRSIGGKFVYLGRIENQEKAILILPEIVKKVMLKSNFECLDIYGEGSDKQNLIESVKRLGLSDVISIKGYLDYDRLHEVLKNYDFLILPSNFEGQGLVALEAMALGVIPIVSRLPGRTESWIKEGVNGFLCKPGDAQDFVSSISKVLERNDLVAISENAKEVVRQFFTLEKMKEDYLKLLQESKESENLPARSGILDKRILGDLPNVPYFMIRPIRKALKIMGLWK